MSVLATAMVIELTDLGPAKPLAGPNSGPLKD